MEIIMSAIKAIRNRRSEMNVPPSKKAKLYIACRNKDVFVKGIPFIERLAYANGVEISDDFDMPSAVTIITSDAKIYIPMDELIDRKEELARLKKEFDSASKKLSQCQNKLNNQGFLSKAPDDVIAKVKEDAKKLQDKIDMLNAAIDNLK